ncbi:MAG TPA: trypsin-like peptidase domain-containing protein [Gemmatimonadaceae bacterium]|jgi:S1-C subfamily serine protease
MSIELRILTGARGGHRERFDKRVIALGRHLQSDLRFDPNADLDVSSRHAEILGNATSGYRIRDAQSTNGTFVNGRRITGDEQLYDGDVIWLGVEGPQVEVRIAGEAGQRAVGPDGVKETVVRSSQQRPSTGERVKVAVQRETAGMRRLLAVAVVLLVGGTGAAYWIGHRESSTQVSELMQLLAQSDSTAARLQSQLRAIGDTTFASILSKQHAELAARVRSASPTATQTELDSLKDELRRRQVIQQGIALLDLSKISVQNDAAVAFLVTELDGKPYGGTAFGVTSRGLLVTNRHNVRSPVSGRPTTRLGVKYANTDVLLHAHVVQVAADSNVDLALVQVDEPGTYPVVAGVARGIGDLHAGSPVVTIGFPHALDVPMEGNIVKTSLTAGTVSKLLPDVVQIDAYASHGSSGSPIFDANGWVIGVIYGGDPQSQGRITYAVPSVWLDGMLKGEARSVLRP